VSNRCSRPSGQQCRDAVAQALQRQPCDTGRGAHPQSDPAGNLRRNGCRLAQLDRIGIIELRPLNRYRLKLAKTFRWRPHGPVMNYFRDHALLDYFRGGFDGTGEGLMLVHGSVSRTLAPMFMERSQRVAKDFAQQHQTDQKLAEKDREGYTLVLAMRGWEFEAFEYLRTRRNTTGMMSGFARPPECRTP